MVQLDFLIILVLCFVGVEKRCIGESVDIPSSSYMFYSALISKGGKIV